MTRYTQLALMLCVAVAGTTVEARADCHKVRGSIAETKFRRTISSAGCWAQ